VKPARRALGPEAPHPNSDARIDERRQPQAPVSEQRFQQTDRRRAPDVAERQVAM